jgi:hypothetical protein
VLLIEKTARAGKAAPANYCLDWPDAVLQADHRTDFEQAEELN